MKVKDLIKELQQQDQDKTVNIFIPKVFGEDSIEDIYSEDILDVIDQDDTVEIYCLNESA
jgi:hypothetical protein